MVFLCSGGIGSVAGCLESSVDVLLPLRVKIIFCDADDSRCFVEAAERGRTEPKNKEGKSMIPSKISDDRQP